MYAVIRTGAKQYRVAKGDFLKIEKIPGQVGEEVELKDVLWIGGTDKAQIGTPTLEGALVTARIMDQGRAKKLLVFKFKKRQGYKKKQGHRQAFTQIEVVGIQSQASEGA